MVRGTREVLNQEERLADLISDRVAPKIVPSLEVLSWRKAQLLLIEIHPSPNRPHHLIRLGSVAGVFVRIGSTNRRADQVLIEELKRYGRITPFDEQPIPDLYSEAVDFRFATEYFKPFRKPVRADLETLRLTTSYKAGWSPQSAASCNLGPAGSIVFRMHGFKRAGSQDWTNERSSTRRRFDHRSRAPPKMFCRSCENIPRAKPQSERSNEPTSGRCRRWRYAKPLSTRSCMRTTLSAERLFEWHSSTTGSKSRTRDFRRSALQSKAFNRESPSFAIG